MDAGWASTQQKSSDTPSKRTRRSEASIRDPHTTQIDCLQLYHGKPEPQRIRLRFEGSNHLYVFVLMGLGFVSRKKQNKDFLRQQSERKFRSREIPVLQEPAFLRSSFAMFRKLRNLNTTSKTSKIRTLLVLVLGHKFCDRNKALRTTVAETSLPRGCPGKVESFLWALPRKVGFFKITAYKILGRAT